METPPATRIALEAASPISTDAELELIRIAYKQRPTPALRRKLARLMSRIADWDGLVELLAPLDELGVDEDLMLAEALLERRSIDRRNQAMAAIECVLAGSGSDAQRAAALVLRAKVEAWNCDWPAARASLRQALALDPANRAACSRLVRIELRTGEVEAALDVVEGLAARGVSHPYVLASRALILARKGRLAEARHAMGTGVLSASQMLAPPPGWADIDAFNAALAAELLAHPDLRYQRYGASPALSWGIDAPFTSAAPLLGRLLAGIADELQHHIAALGQIDHPWLRIRPARTMLHCSCVMTEAEDYEDWHLHPTGWLNGVYYVRIPEGITGETEAGCLAFGLPDDLAGSEAAGSYGREVIVPHGGMLVAFPSHTYHRTYAHGCEGRRIAVTFELRPN